VQQIETQDNLKINLEAAIDPNAVTNLK